MPASLRSELASLSKDAMLKIGKVSGQVHSPIVREKIANLIREMNCYYSNLIEGHKTVPKDIERALQQKFSDDPVKRDNQRLSKAHIAVENLMLEKLKKHNCDIYTPEFICWLHLEFYKLLPESMRQARTCSGEEYEITPGKFRDFMVDVGRHTPPHYRNLPKFIDRFCEFYRSPRINDTNRLIAIASAHHRLAWIHPFGDGNGRVMRLYSHAMLVKHGLDGGGLWTLSRGLARYKKSYYESLDNADQPRRGDLDGRGNLTDHGLAAFCKFFLETMLDQINFMSEKLALPSLRGRVEDFFQREAKDLGKDGHLLMKIVRALIDEGEFPRARAQELTGRGETVCRRIIQLGLHHGLIESPSPKGVLQIAFPSKVLESYFPRLFLDLDV